MKQGYWISSKTGQKWEVIEHATFAKDPSNPLGLSEALVNYLRPLSLDYIGPDRAKIVTAVCKAGFIRMRGHGASWTFEFWNNRSTNLWHAHQLCTDWAGPFTHLTLTDLKTMEQWQGPFSEMDKIMKDEGPEGIIRLGSRTAACKWDSRLLKESVEPFGKTSAGYPRLMQIMMGQIPTVTTFGIMSPENPQGQEATPEHNRKERQRLKDILKNRYGYVVHSGFYGSFEHAFFIMNISYKTLYEMAQEFDQETFIYGEVTRGETPQVEFKLVKAADGRVEGSRKIVWGEPTAKAVHNQKLERGEKEPEFYSISHGRKYLIPFFDDDFTPTSEQAKETNMPEGAPFLPEEVEGDPENADPIGIIRGNAPRVAGVALGSMANDGRSFVARSASLQALNRIKKVRTILPDE